VVQHVPYEGPGLIGVLLREAGHRVTVHRMWAGDTLPAVGEIDGLVVLGGPMGALDDDTHPHLQAERALLTRAVAAGLPVLGVCLGAQLLAVAYGGTLSSGATYEVGPGEVTLTPEAAVDPAFAGLGPTLPVVHWHEDTVTLPEGAALLARSGPTPVQAFRLGGRAYGFQFHVEIDQETAAVLRPELLAAGVALPSDAVEAVMGVGRSLLERVLGTHPGWL
jgi:GMP synthase (glutamine-hydrolysing)